MADPRFIQPKLTRYFKSTWYIRWVIIAIVVASIWFVPVKHLHILEPMIILAVTYNIILKLVEITRPNLVDRTIMLFIDGILSVVLVIFTGGIASPYIVILPFMVISSAYWYGSLIAAITGLLETIALLAVGVVWQQNEKGQVKVFLAQMAVLVSIGLYVGWITKSERLERSELMALEAETENERRRLIALINNLSDGVFVIDPKGNVMIANQPGFNLTGQKEVLNQPLKHLLNFVDSDSNPIDLDFHHLASAHTNRDLRVKAPDGSYISVSASVAPYIVDRQHSGYIVIIRDQSEYKTVEQERKEFVAIAGHELRTPLTIAQGNLSFLLSPEYRPTNPDAVKMLNGAVRSLKQLSRIINDLTNLFLVSNEQLNVELEPLNPVTLLQELAADFQDQAKTKGLTLNFKVDSSINPPTILTSRYVVQEILTSLISNAIKFTEKGVITLAIEDPKDKPGGITFSVLDTGIGITSSDKKKIFEKFFQAEDYMTRVHGGTGLGLYITKKLSDRLTASIWFESEKDKGSKFYLWVPPYSHYKQDRAKVASAETKDLFSGI